MEHLRLVSAQCETMWQSSREEKEEEEGGGKWGTRKKEKAMEGGREEGRGRRGRER